MAGVASLRLTRVPDEEKCRGMGCSAGPARPGEARSRRPGQPQMASGGEREPCFPSGNSPRFGHPFRISCPRLPSGPRGTHRHCPPGSRPGFLMPQFTRAVLPDDAPEGNDPPRDRRTVQGLGALRFPRRLARAQDRSRRPKGPGGPPLVFLGQGRPPLPRMRHRSRRPSMPPMASIRVSTTTSMRSTPSPSKTTTRRLDLPLAACLPAKRSLLQASQNGGPASPRPDLLAFAVLVP